MKAHEVFPVLARPALQELSKIAYHRDVNPSASESFFIEKFEAQYSGE